MLRGGGLCVASPEESSLTRVSPRIRALQDRLLDSLPADGAWECLSPAQREAIISLHRARITRNLEERESPGRKRHHLRNPVKGLYRYGRSRSYEDKLESETDDSGVRLQSGGTNTSSTSNSHNSQEDDSSDPGVKKAGRFAKSPSADKLLKKDAKNLQDFGKRKGVANGVGNVNKIISKQLTRVVNQPSSKITLDCRNYQGDRNRCRIDKYNPFVLESETAPRSFEKRKNASGISRKNILKRYDVAKPANPKEIKSSTSSDDFENAVHFNRQKSSSKGFEDLGKKLPIPRVDYDFEFESDLTPRSDSTPSPFDRKYPIGYQEERNRYSWTEGIIGSSPSHFLDDSPEDRKSSNNSGSGSNTRPRINSKVNPTFDYRKEIKLEHFNKYSSNWNSIMLCNRVPIKSSSKPRTDKSRVVSRPVRATEPFHGTSSGDSGYRGEVGPPLGSRGDRVLAKKYSRSKSLDRQLDDSTDEDSDFEFRRRTDRMRRYARVCQDNDASIDSSSRAHVQFDTKYPSTKQLENSLGRKAKSAWDISHCKTEIKDDFDDFNDKCFRSRSSILNKWKSEDGELALGAKSMPTKYPEEEFNRLQWQRRSCDILELSDSDSGKKRPRVNSNDFNKQKWHRRSLDGQLDLEEEVAAPKRKLHLCDPEWDDSISKGMQLIQRRELLKKATNPRLAAPQSSREDSPPHHQSRYRERPATSGEISRRRIVNKAQTQAQIPSRFYTRAPCPDHGWVPVQDPKLSKKKHERKKSPGAFRGKLKLFRSILSF